MYQILKRVFDISGALVLGLALAPVFLSITVWMYLKGDLPVLYISERMKSVDRPFRLYKFRTMKPPRSDGENTGVSGGDKADRITPLGSFLRRYRLDEIPQLLNILLGDMSFVGPRPPLRRYTETHRALYEQVLRSKPGVTGLASMTFHKHEERLLAEAATATETEAIYVNRCIPRKAQIDLIYQQQASVCYDVVILWRTFVQMLP